MRYMLLIYGDESHQAEMTEEQGKQNMQAWFAYTDDLAAQGIMRAGDALQPSMTGKTVRGPGTGTVTDGPHGEAREQMGGYYMLECDEAAALAAAAACPAVLFGGAVEVRPIMELPPR